MSTHQPVYAQGATYQAAQYTQHATDCLFAAAYPTAPIQTRAERTYQAARSAMYLSIP